MHLNLWAKLTGMEQPRVGSDAFEQRCRHYAIAIVETRLILGQQLFVLSFITEMCSRTVADIEHDNRRATHISQIGVGLLIGENLVCGAQQAGECVNTKSLPHHARLRSTRFESRLLFQLAPEFDPRE